MFRRIVFIIVIILLYKNSFSQPVDSLSFKLNTRYSFYTFEKRSEFLLHIPQNLIYSSLLINIEINSQKLASWNGVSGNRILRIPFNINLPVSKYSINAEISIKGKNVKYIATTDLVILNYKPNEVKTDRLTGGLIANKRQFFPFGFYCYSPVPASLPEEEVVKGFNLISPYQRILPQTLNERKEYMDRCAELGMKVNFNLLSVSGGGGVGSDIDGVDVEEKDEWLINEINEFRDHPALLSWYIADEPNGRNIAPGELEEIYQIVKKYDPWHPVTMVFMAPHTSAVLYSDALDIVMADSYPVPDLPVTVFGNVTRQLINDFRGRKSVWMVPQTFGGGEIWEREPTYQEIRSMTYQSVINGARGIQYFIRQGLNLFPKSASAWGECGRMAVEIAELTPWLLSDEETIPARSASRNILVTSAMHEGQLMIMAVNITNTPQKADIRFSGQVSGRASVLFENRAVRINSGYFTDQIGPYGSQVYMIDIEPKSESIKSFMGNLLPDPGFEDLTNTGVPVSCYARNGGDRGATYFLDSRDHVEGNHSVRIITPKNNGSIKLRFFPVPVKPGQKYLVSVYAKADPEQRSLSDIEKPQFFEISFGAYGKKSFKLSDEWKEFVTIVEIPTDGDLPAKANLVLQMPSAGIAWFDMLQVIECVDIKQSINPELNWDIFK